MIRRISLIRRRADLTPEEFRRYWLEHHAPVGLALPGLRGYRINTVVQAPAGFEWDGIGELWFDSIGAADAAFADPSVANLVKEDIVKFVAEACPFFVEEHVVKAPPADRAGAER